MNIETRLSALRTKHNKLVDKFRKSPRQFDKAEWNQLRQLYVDAGCVANAAEVAERIKAYEYIIANEHTPTLPGEEAWQLRKDVA